MDLYYAGGLPEYAPLHGSPYPPPVAYRHEPDFVEAPAPERTFVSSSTTTTTQPVVAAPRRRRATWIWVIVIIVIIVLLIAVGVYLYYYFELRPLGAGSACTSNSRCTSGVCTGGTCT
jgi:hypothetical protein